MLVKEKISEILKILHQKYPHAKMILNYSNHWELLVAVVLSAQCTDKKVNEVTNKLFAKYQKSNIKIQKYNSKIKSITPEIQEIINFAQMPLVELENDVKSTGFYHNKAKNIQNAAKIILEKFNGKIPPTIEEITTPPGVARKSANVILGNAFGIVEGIAVDTHVCRISQRLGLTKNTDPVKIENDLMQLLPKTEWFKWTYLVIDFGRSICDAKHPMCRSCPLNKICPSAFKVPGYK